MENVGLFQGESRGVTLGSPTLQNSTRRICLPITMALTGETMQGLPDWLSEAYVAVARNFTEVSPSLVMLTDLTLAFAAGKKHATLFDSPDVLVRQAEIRKFSVKRAGSPENPDIELHFKVYIAFNRKFWVWLGERVGTKDEIHMAFPGSLGETVDKPVEQPRELDFGSDTPAPVANSAEPLEFDSGASAGGSDDGEEPEKATRASQPKLRSGRRPTKSGRRELAAEQAKHLEKAHKPPRDAGRPPVDPLTVN